MRVGTRKDAAVYVPLANHGNAIKTALAKGHSFATLADYFGISHQGVIDYCSNHDLGRPTKRTCRTHRIKRVFACSTCKKMVACQPNQRGSFLFCSQACAGVSRRNLRLNGIVEAISRRLNGVSWGAVAKSYDCTVQAIQISIFQYLHANGLFSPAAMASIWFLEEGPHSRSSAKYSWLVNQSRRLLSEHALSRYRGDCRRDLVAGLLAQH